MFEVGGAKIHHRNKKFFSLSLDVKLVGKLQGQICLLFFSELRSVVSARRITPFNCGRRR